MDAVVDFLRILIGNRNYLIAAAVLAALVFVLRNLGAGAELPILFVATIYIVGGLAGMIVMVEQMFSAVSAFANLLAARRTSLTNLGHLSRVHRACLTYIKQQGAQSFSAQNYATLAQLVQLSLLTSSNPAANHDAYVTFTVPTAVWNQIRSPAWQEVTPTPGGPPWDMMHMGPYIQG